MNGFDTVDSAVPGRPFINNDDKSISSKTIIDNDSMWSNSVTTTTIDNDKAMKWQQQALGEHASIASFNAFSLQLMVNAAPPSLLRAASKAADDEVRHAQMVIVIM
jgi:hypothetical protein